MTPHIFLVAGEPSGDRLGAALMRALKEITGGDIQFSGIGGTAMEAEGLKSVFPMRDLSIMGLAEVIPHIPRVLRRLREARDAVLTANPDVLVTIDAQVFSAMLAKRVAAARPDPWRAKSAAKIYDHMLTLFPFEPHYFEEHGLEATCVGHPLAERVEALDPEAPDALRAELGIAQDAPVLLIAPGSRRAEIARLANRFGDALAWLSPHIEGLEAILPVSPAVEARVEQIVADWPVKPHLLSVRGLSHEDAERRKFAAFAAADAALAASGTVTLEHRIPCECDPRAQCHPGVFSDQVLWPTFGPCIAALDAK